MDTTLEYACKVCGQTAVWVRHSQVSDIGYYCNVHAIVEEDFKQHAPHYFWEELYGERRTDEHVHTGHPTDVPGYAGTLNTLAKEIHSMRYDKVVEFYHHTLNELHRQAANDRLIGHPQLAILLEEAAGDVLDLRELFSRIYALCRPHMPGAP